MGDKWKVRAPLVGEDVVVPRVQMKEPLPKRQAEASWGSVM